MTITNLIEAVEADRVRITDRAEEEAHALRLTADEVNYSVRHGEVVEEYPSRPYPTCLVHGPTYGGNPIHTLWAYSQETGWAAWIRVFRPVAAPEEDAAEGKGPA